MNSHPENKQCNAVLHVALPTALRAADGSKGGLTNIYLGLNHPRWIGCMQMSTRGLWLAVCKWVRTGVRNCSGINNLATGPWGAFHLAFCHKLLKSLHLIGWEQICQWKTLTKRLMKCPPGLRPWGTSRFALVMCVRARNILRPPPPSKSWIRPYDCSIYLVYGLCFLWNKNRNKSADLSYRTRSYVK